MADKLKVAIIGLQHLHPEHYMPHFLNCEDTEVVAVCEELAEMRNAFAEKYSLAAFDNIDAMLDNIKLDMAAIFLPHCDCLDAARKCAKKGVHLMIEKPIAQTSEQVRQIAKITKEANVKITTGYCWRYHPVIKAAKELIEQGAIGKVVSVEARLAAGKVDRYVKGNASWMLEKAKSGGGPLYNLGVHWLDVLNHILSDKVTDVCALNTKVSTDYDIEDGTTAMLRFAGGATGVLQTSYIVPDCYPNGRDLYIGIKGTDGVINYAPGYEGESGTAGGSQTDVLEIYSDSPKLKGAAARKLVFNLDKTSGYSGFMGKVYIEDFAKAILNDTSPFITIEESIDVLDVVDAIYESHEQGKWVKI